MTEHKEVTFRIPEEEYEEIKGELDKGHQTDKFISVDEKLKDLVKDDLVTDGAYHKQWYLERIAERLRIDTSDIVYKTGKTP